MNLFFDAWAWLSQSSSWSGEGGIGARLLEHAVFSLAIVVAACVVALPVGIAAGHLRRGANVVVWLSSSARAVPTLGLLTLVGLFVGIGYAAPFAALLVLALPSILAGAYSGVEAVDHDAVDAARANGMTEWQVVRQVELPLALPVILGGVRAGVLQVIATATLAAYTADLGLGRFIFTGIKSRDYAMALGGALIVMALALIVDLALAQWQRRLRHRGHPSEPHPKGIA